MPDRNEETIIPESDHVCIYPDKICKDHYVEVERRKMIQRESDRIERERSKDKDRLDSAIRVIYALGFFVTISMFMMGGAFYFSNEIREESHRDDLIINNQISKVTKQVSDLALQTVRNESKHASVLIQLTNLNNNLYKLVNKDDSN